MMSFRPLIARFDAPAPWRARRPLVWAALVCCVLLPTLSSRAQTNPAPGSLDTDFVGSLTQVTAYAVTVDSQQRVIVGGDGFTLARFLPTGSVDTAFQLADFGNNGRIVFGLAVDYENKIVVVGKFNRGGTGMNAENITRLKDDGSLDDAFDPGIGTNDSIIALLVQPPVNGDITTEKFYIGGRFTLFNNEKRERLTRINRDGTLDTTFDSSLSFDADVFALAFGRDPANGGALNGAVYVGGKFESVNGSSLAKLARINADGSVDASFAPSVDNDVFAIAVQPDGKIIIGGQFQNVNGVQANGLARLNPDGSLDASFTAGVQDNDNKSVPPTAVYTLALQQNGRILVGGNFLTLNGASRRFLGRLEADGSLDTSFDPGTNVANRTEALAIVPGDFSTNTVDKIYVAQFVSKRIGANYPFVTVRLYGDPEPPGPASVTITAVERSLEIGSKGVFRLQRSGGDVTQPLTVFYRLIKTNKPNQAQSGVDFVPLPGSITFAANQTVAKIKVKQLLETGVPPVKKIVSLRLVDEPTGTPSGGLSYLYTGDGKAKTVVLANP